MARIDESLNQSQMKAELVTGYNTLDGDERITFLKYTRYVLPIDGYVFWIRDTTANPLVVEGSLHYSTDQEQREDETIGINRVILTTAKQVQDFNSISSDTVYIGQTDSIRFAFTATGKFYKQAEIYHYRGDAIYPAMESQIIDNPVLPISIPQVATNSLPIWLSLNSFTSAIPYPVIVGTLYPAFLLPSNLRPPYIGVDIQSTDALGATPEISQLSAHSQLMADKIKITTYGLGNNQILDFIDFVNKYSLEYDNIGVMNMPRVYDERRTQSELGIVAAKKTIEYEVSYYQHRSNNIARKLILQCLPNFVFT